MTFTIPEVDSLNLLQRAQLKCYWLTHFQIVFEVFQSLEFKFVWGKDFKIVGQSIEQLYTLMKRKILREIGPWEIIRGDLFACSILGF